MLVRDQEVVGSNPVTSTKNPAELLLCGVFVCCTGIGLPTSCVPLPSALFFKGPPQKGAAFLWGKEARRRWFVGSAAPDKRAKPAPTRFGTKRSWVQIPSPRPRINRDIDTMRISVTVIFCLFIVSGGSFTSILGFTPGFFTLA